MFGMCKIKHSSKDCNRSLFIVNKIDISDLVGKRLSSIIINFEQVMKPFLVWDIYFTFFYQWSFALFTRVLLRITVHYYYVTYTSEAVVRRCSVKKVFIEISQKSQENTCSRVSFLIKLQVSFFYRTPPVAASGVSQWIYTL